MRKPHQPFDQRRKYSQNKFNANNDDVAHIFDAHELQRLKKCVGYLDKIRCNVEQIDSGGTAATPLDDNNAPTEKDWIDASQSFTSSFQAPDLPLEFGRFQIVKELGEGGFANVFLAFDPRLNRNVAIKIPKPGRLRSDVERERFNREAKAAALLNHPNIIPILETDHVNQVQYIASAYCDGPTLADWMRDHQPTITQDLAAQIVIQLAEAVQHAHQRGILHRDLKPSNVLLALAENDRSIDGANSWQVKITDFGLAKQLNADEYSLTIDGAVVGTPAYMSPEQARGASAISAASDVYSLGVILFELLTGCLPHEGATHMETLHLVSFQRAISPRKFRSAISRDLESICLKAMDPVQKARYASAYEFASDLKNWLNGQSIRARRAGPIRALSRWSSRNPAIAASIALVIGSLILGMSLTTWQYRQSQKHLVASESQRLRAVSHLQQLESMADFILAEFGPDENHQQLDETQIRVLNRMLAIHQSMVRDEAAQINVDVALIENYLRISRIFGLLGDYDQASEYVDIAIELTRSGNIDDAEREAIAKKRYEATFLAFNLAFKHGSKSDLDNRLAKLKETLAWDQMRLSRKTTLDREYTYYRHLGLVENRKQNYQLAETAMLTAYEKIQALLSLQPNDQFYNTMRLRSMLELADVSWSMTRHQEAIDYYVNLIEVFDQAPDSLQQIPGNMLVLADCHSNLGHAVCRRDQPTLAIEHYEKSLLIHDQIEKVSPGLSTGRRVHLLIRIAYHCTRHDQPERGIVACHEGLALINDLPVGRFRTMSEIDLLVQRAQIELQAGSHRAIGLKAVQEAIQLASHAVEQHPDWGPMYALLGKGQYFKGMYVLESDQAEAAMQYFGLALDNFEQCHRRRNFRASPKRLAIKSTTAIADFAIAQEDFQSAVAAWERLFTILSEETLFYVESFKYFTKKLTSMGSDLSETDLLQAAALRHLSAAIELGYKESM